MEADYSIKSQNIEFATFYENSVYKIGNNIEVTDPDITIENCENIFIFVSLHVQNGILFLKENENINFYENETIGIEFHGNFDSVQQLHYNGSNKSVFFSGKYEDVLIALQSLHYAPNINWHGSDILTIYVNDLGMLLIK